MTKITSVEDLDVSIHEHDVTSNTVTLDWKFTSVHLGELTIVYLYPKCYSEGDIQDEIAISDHCSTVSVEDQCSSKCKVGCTVIDNDTKVKYKVVVPHNILKEVVPASLEEKITFVKLFLKGTYTFKINTQNNTVLTFSLTTYRLFHQRDLNQQRKIFSYSFYSPRQS